MDRRADHTLFAHVAARDEEEIDLAAAALLIAEIEYPELDASDYLHRIDGMADAVASGAEDDVDERLDRLVDHLFGDLGFRGNDEDYFDPDNSFLHRVMDRRIGIPITLSILFLEVGWRAGLDLQGIAFPGHFLVQCHSDEHVMVLDPYHRGVILGPDDLEARLARVFGKPSALKREHLQPASRRQILMRMLNNLRLVYQRKGEAEKERETLERMLILSPGDARIAQSVEKAREKRAGWN